MDIILGLEFALELFFAESIFLLTLNRKRHWVPISTTNLCILCAFSVWFPNMPLSMSTPVLPILIYSILFALSVGCAARVVQAPVWSVLFCCIAGYLTQHFAFNLVMIVQELRGVKDADPIYWGSVCLIYGTIYLLAWHIFARKLRNGECGTIGNHALISMLAILLCLTVVLNILSNEGDRDSFTAVMLRLYACLGCALSLALQFGLWDNTEIRRELESVQQMMRQAQKQYELSKETTELIDVLCHDLKHQLVQPDALLSVPTAYLQKIERKIDIYNSIARTGNQTLDVILTETALRCTKEDIKLTCMADGESLSFVEEVDLYSLFGNALSNAIEGVRKVTAPEKRFVSLTVKRIGGFLSIQVENYFSGQLTFSGDLPDTTKANQQYHGLGMKSMRYIVEKYDGNLSVVVHDEIFTLNIFLLIP